MRASLSARCGVSLRMRGWLNRKERWRRYGEQSVCSNPCKDTRFTTQTLRSWVAYPFFRTRASRSRISSTTWQPDDHLTTFSKGFPVFAESRPSCFSNWQGTPCLGRPDAGAARRDLDWRLRRGFDAVHDVIIVRYRGWGGKTNGELLRAAAAEFDVFVTLDSNLEYQNNVAALDLAIIVIRTASSDLADIESALPKLNALLPSVRPGKAYIVVA